MKLKLKEEPRAWLEYTAVMGVAAVVVALVLWRRHWITLTSVGIVAGIGVIGTLACALRPRWFRGFYRAGMTFNFHLGSFLGRIWLGLFFLLILTPLGWLLRLGGKDLLELKWRRPTPSYWKPVEKQDDLERLF